MGSVYTVAEPSTTHPVVNDIPIEQWMKDYGNAVLRLAYSFLGDRQRAEDVFQDVFLQAYRHAAQLR